MSKIQQRIRIEGKYLDLLTKIQRENDFKNSGEAIEYIINEYLMLKERVDETSELISNMKKITLIMNQNSKDIKTLVEFANTTAYLEGFDENRSTHSEPTSWLESAKKDVETQIEEKRIRKMTNKNRRG
ncbi:TPA: hypothetical protein ACONBN_002684 [Staphylococcus aureus]|nr:hypothetical protein [Staphylococcus aureus]